MLPHLYGVSHLHVKSPLMGPLYRVICVLFRIIGSVVLDIWLFEIFYSLPLAQQLVPACRHPRIFNCQLPALLQKVLGSLMATATATATRTAKSNGFRFAKQQLCRCITFFIHFFAVTARVRREMPYFKICRGRQLSFFYLNFDIVL